MSLDWIKTPITQEQPCGPDLWEAYDETYSDYYFDALGRLPEADDYVKLGLVMGDAEKQPDTIFDPTSVDLKAELTSIDGLLKQTRDLRLVTLRAQWSALAGDLAALNESVAAMADVLEAFPDDAYPTLADGPRDRLDAINDLSATGAMILPLRYYDISDTGASRRRFMVCAGEVTPHDGEEDLSLDDMIGELSYAKEEVEDEHTLLKGVLVSIGKIEAACKSHSNPHNPQLQPLKSEIAAVLAVMEQAVPALEPEEDATEDVADEAGAAAPSAPGMVPAPKATEVKSHDEAKRRLIAVETYFGKNEPSSATLLLVTQARLLIGKSLVEAFDTLMPHTADRAKVDFISDNGFALSASQLRALADQVIIEETPEPDPAPQPPSAPVDPALSGDGTSPDPAEPAAPPPQAALAETVFKIATAAEAGSQILAVETYFRAVEKSSPVPTLLMRARSYIGKDFEALLKEFVPTL